MATKSEQKRAAREQGAALEAERRAAEHARRLRNRVLFGVGGAIAVLALVFVISSGGGGSGGSGGSGGNYAFQVGSPGPGQPAPAIQLASTQGGQFDLAAQRGKAVLLYFQEGLSCEPCWTQLKDLDHQSAALKAMGVNELVTVTTDPLGDLQTKVSDEGISTPVLSDPNLTVSQQYSANQYGMMGTSRDGHSFILVGPDGRIRWRGDYGGSPNYTMYVPVAHLLADIRKGIGAA